jgi:flagellar basal body-associated protein FliL
MDKEQLKSKAKSAGPWAQWISIISLIVVALTAYFEYRSNQVELEKLKSEATTTQNAVASSYNTQNNSVQDVLDTVNLYNAKTTERIVRLEIHLTYQKAENKKLTQDVISLRNLLLRVQPRARVLSPEEGFVGPWPSISEDAIEGLVEDEKAKMMVEQRAGLPEATKDGKIKTAPLGLPSR